MFGRKKDKEANRYYLLPGMGRANRRKHRIYFRVALAVGVIVSLFVGSLIWILNTL